VIFTVHNPGRGVLPLGAPPHIIHSFARALLPELRDYIEIPYLPRLVEPWYALDHVILFGRHLELMSNAVRENCPRTSTAVLDM
jgi:hypothetical protein